MFRITIFVAVLLQSLLAFSGENNSFDVLYSKAMSKLSKNPKTTITILLEAEKKAFSESNKENLAQCYWALGYTYQVMSQVANSKKYYLGALRVYESLGDQSSQLLMLENIGTLALDNGLAKSANRYYQKRLSIALKSENSLWICEAYIDLGLATKEMNLPDSASTYFESASNTALQVRNNEDLLSRIYNQIGITKKTLALINDEPNLIDSAEVYFRKSLKLAKKSVNKFHASNNIGSIQIHRKNYNDAINWFNSAYKIGEALNSNRLLITVINNLGIIYYKLEKLAAADSLFNKAITLSMYKDETRDIMRDIDLILSFDDVKQGILSLQYLDSINQILPFSQLKSAALARINSEAFERQIIVSQERANMLASELALIEDDFIPEQIKTKPNIQYWIIIAMSIAGLVMAVTIYILLKRNSKVSL